LNRDPDRSVARASTGRPIDPVLEDWLAEHLPEGEVLGSGYQAIVRRFLSPVGELVVKSPHPGLLHKPIGRLSIRREYRIYERLSGLAGVPRLHGLALGTHLVLEYVAGAPLRARQQTLADRERFFARLLQTIRSMHAAGVAHGDLKRKDNIVVGPDETPYVIDFGVARMRGGRAKWHDGLLFDIVQQTDLNAWIKLKHGRVGGELPPADAAIYRPQWTERIARWFRIVWQKATLRRPRQRWRRERERGRGP
jgi:predicted Ser/Thr protein kinase